MGIAGAAETRASRARGKPKFVPTDQQRLFVAGMAGINMAHHEMASLILNAPRRLSQQCPFFGQFCLLMAKT
jgi:hypothetical protein